MVDSQIVRLVKKFKLETVSAVDGWYVELDGCHHTAQVDITELPVHNYN